MRSELEAALPDAFFAGQQRGAELARWYASADVFVFPSTTETFGNVVLESLASGVPAVVVDSGGPQDLVDDGVTGFIARSRDTADIAAKTAALLREPDLRAAMATRGAVLRARPRMACHQSAAARGLRTCHRGACCAPRGGCMKVCDLTQSYAPTGGGIRTFLHAKRDYLLARTNAEHVLIVPGEKDAVERRGRSTTIQSLRRSCPARRSIGCCCAVTRCSNPACRGTDDHRCTLRVQPAVDGTLVPSQARRGGDRILSYRFPGGVRRAVRVAVCRATRGCADAPVAIRYARALYERFDARVAISGSVAEALRRRGMRDVRHISLGVDLDIFSPARRDPPCAKGSASATTAGC
jgi:glycosyltransferase involved in cell wall biosynthesis